MNEKKGKLKRNSIIIATMFFFSLAIRLLFINAGLWHHDSVQAAIAVEKGVDELRVYPISSGKYGYILINEAVFLLFHILGVESADRLLTLSTIVFASADVVLMYVFVKKFLNNASGIISGLLFSISPLFLSATTYAKSHAMAVFFVLLSFVVLLKGFEADSLKLKLLSALSIGYALFVRPSSAFMVVPFLFMALFHRKIFNIKKPEKRAEHFTLLCLVLFACVALFSALHYQTIVSHARYDRFLGITELTVLNAFVIVKALTPLGIVLAILGAAHLLHKNPWLALFLASWFFPTFLYHANLTTANSRFFIQATLALIVMIGAGFEFISQINLKLSIILALITAAWMIHTAYPIISTRHRLCGGKELGSFVREHTESNAIVITFGDTIPFIKYYGNRTSASCSMREEEVSKLVSSIHAALMNGIPVYYSETCAYHPGQEVVDREIRRNFNLELVGKHFYEDYHQATLKLEPTELSLFRIRLISSSQT